MNDRIKELITQAGGHWNHGDFNMPSSVEFQEQDIAKFAELIVGDCLDQIESQRSSGENSDQWTITRDMCYHNMIAGLKQHFGVE